MNEKNQLRSEGKMVMVTQLGTEKAKLDRGKLNITNLQDFRVAKGVSSGNTRDLTRKVDI